MYLGVLFLKGGVQIGYHNSEPNNTCIKFKQVQMVQSGYEPLHTYKTSTKGSMGIDGSTSSKVSQVW